MSNMIQERPEVREATAWDEGSLLRPLLLASLSFGILSFVLPIYGKRMGASAPETGGMFSALGITMAISRPFVGWALDRFGRKPFFVAGLLCRAGSLALFALAGDMVGLYLARLAQGFASSFTWIPAYTIIDPCPREVETGGPRYPALSSGC